LYPNSTILFRIPGTQTFILFSCFFCNGVTDPLSEKEMLEELYVFVKNLNIDCYFITHHTIAARLSGPDFLKRKEHILADLRNAIDHGDHAAMAALRRNKQTL